jgi:Asp-tRNA(Asn)/Glu-tRNA(Gln) amidotransferase A subunit family amidase
VCLEREPPEAARIIAAIARTVSDVALFLSTIAGPSEGSPATNEDRSGATPGEAAEVARRSARGQTRAALWRERKLWTPWPQVRPFDKLRAAASTVEGGGRLRLVVPIEQRDLDSVFEPQGTLHSAAQ